MKKIEIRTIPHAYQRYDTCGDWEDRKMPSWILISVSEIGNSDMEFLVGLHEMIEAYLCLKKGIAQEKVDRFDKNFEKKRKKGNTGEPGDDPKAPYFHEHQFATFMESIMAKELDVNWEKYNKKLDSL